MSAKPSLFPTCTVVHAGTPIYGKGCKSAESKVRMASFGSRVGHRLRRFCLKMTFLQKSHDMALLTFNVADFVALAAKWYAEGREHAGIILSEQLSRRRFGTLLRLALRLLDDLTSEELRNSVIDLQQFR